MQGGYSWTLGLLPGSVHACIAPTCLLHSELSAACQPQLMPAPPLRAKPLREFDPQRTGREWRRPSPTTEIKVCSR